MSFTLTEAVNLCLAGIGRAPVANPEEDDIDAAMALTVINRESRAVQSKGWHFNREFNWKLFPDAITGEVYAPANALDIISWGTSYYCDLTLRGSRIYNKVNHSYDLRDVVNKEGSIEFAFITELPFDELPHYAASAIAYRARRIFASDAEGDNTKLQANIKDENDAMTLLTVAEGRNSKHNYSNNGTIGSFMAAVGGEHGGMGYMSAYKGRRSTNG